MLPPEDRVTEALRRGRRYLGAGATCVYPTGATDPAEISVLVEQTGGPVNFCLRPDGPPLAELHRIGVARISLAAARRRRHRRPGLLSGSRRPRPRAAPPKPPNLRR